MVNLHKRPRLVIIGLTVGRRDRQRKDYEWKNGCVVMRSRRFADQWLALPPGDGDALTNPATGGIHFSDPEDAAEALEQWLLRRNKGQQ